MTLNYKKVTNLIIAYHSALLRTEAHSRSVCSLHENKRKQHKLEFGMYPQSMPTEWTHARTLRPWQRVRLDL